MGNFSFIDTDDETAVSVNVTDYKIVDNNWWSFGFQEYKQKY